MSPVHSQSPSEAMTVISANVEGLSANTAYILSELCKIQHYHCLCLQETHRAKDQSRPKITGMTVVAECPHKHGSSVFVIIIVIYSICIALYNTLLCCEYYKIDSDFSICGTSVKHVFIIPSAHVRIHVNTHKLTIHTYGIHNDITKPNQPNVTVINVN